MRDHFLSGLAALALAFLALGFLACGGGGGGESPGASITGTVSGTIVFAVDEAGKIAARDDTAGKTPDTSGHYPFSLSVPAGHRYCIYFLVDAGTPAERTVPLYSGSTNLFEVVKTATIDLGFVDTSGAEAAAERDPLLDSGIGDGGENGPPTLAFPGFKWLLLYDRGGTRKYRAQAQVAKASDGSALTDKSLIRDVKMYDSAMAPLPTDGEFQLFDGSGLQSDTGAGPAPTPISDVEQFLAAAVGTLTEGIYTLLVTDNNAHLHCVKLYFRPPDEVAKPSSLDSVVNTDNSITLSWTTPTLPAAEYYAYLFVYEPDANGDGLTDVLLSARITPVSASSQAYTIPETFVESNLLGKSGLKWLVMIRQYDSSVPGAPQLYRQYSTTEPDLPLPASPTPGFTTAMLSGKVYYEETTAGGTSGSNLFYFNADSTFATDWYEFDGSVESSGRQTGSWSIDPSGKAIVNIAGQGTVTVTLLSESSTEMQVSVDDGVGTPTLETLEKTVPVDPLKLPGTYTQSKEGHTWGFNSNGTGTCSIFGGMTFTWTVDSGVLKMPFSNGYSAWFYARAGTQSTASNYTVLKVGFPEYAPGGILYKYYGGRDLTRQ